MGYEENRDHGPWADDIAFFDLGFNFIRCLLCTKEGGTILGKPVLSPYTCNASAAYMRNNCNYVEDKDIKIITHSKPYWLEKRITESIPIPEPLLKKATKTR